MILFQTQLEKEWFLSQIRSQLPIQERAFAINAILMNFQLKRGTFDIFQSREILYHVWPLKVRLFKKNRRSFCLNFFTFWNLKNFYIFNCQKNCLTLSLPLGTWLSEIFWSVQSYKFFLDTNKPKKTIKQKNKQTNTQTNKQTNKHIRLDRKPNRKGYSSNNVIKLTSGWN